MTDLKKKMDDGDWPVEILSNGPTDAPEQGDEADDGGAG